jgi:hypothetical protein
MIPRARSLIKWIFLLILPTYLFADVVFRLSSGTCCLTFFEFIVHEDNLDLETRLVVRLNDTV